MPKDYLPSSESIDDYLKAIYEIGQDNRKASTTEIAKKLAIAAASVTGMLQKLAAQTPALVRYEKHRGVLLTVDGERRALEVIRHHRLLECFLQDTLGYEWHEVHQEAERLEHFISEDFEERVAARLGDPEFDPHGHPIPRKDGSIPDCNDAPLQKVAEGVAVRVSRVSDEDPSTLRLLAAHGVKPNVVLQVVEHRRTGDGFAPDGTVLRRLPEAPFTVSAEVASRIAVEVLAETPARRAPKERSSRP
ncbi:MAG: metal-dependent transcriptional regulator [Bryobacterales bacterium]|nr:metal-dependent transcriptional regulator [Bryobacterales bacterium]